MCDYEEIPMKSTDDFYTYNNQGEIDIVQQLMDEFVEVSKLTPAQIDGYDDSQDAWGFDPFGPDADVWRRISE